MITDAEWKKVEDEQIAFLESIVQDGDEKTHIQHSAARRMLTYREGLEKTGQPVPARVFYMIFKADAVEDDLCSKTFDGCGDEHSDAYMFLAHELRRIAEKQFDEYMTEAFYETESCMREEYSATEPDHQPPADWKERYRRAMTRAKRYVPQRIRLYNARILTMEDDKEVFSGELWVEDGRIRFVGESGEALRKREEGLFYTTFDQEIDCHGNLLMPGFKNAHTHSAMTLMRSLADDLPLSRWLNEQIFPVEAKLTEEDIYHLTKLAYMEYLTSGITACFDMYLTPDSIARASRETGFRTVQVGAVNNFSQSPEMVENLYKKYNTPFNLYDPYNGYRLGFHAEYTCSRELLEEIAALAKKYEAPVFTHISETADEVAGCKERYGMTPLKFLDSLGMFEHGGGGYHVVHVTDEEIGIMKERGMYAITNPGSNTKLASGIAPIAKFLAAGVPVAIGTDGPASNNALDMFREMFLVTGLAKLKDRDASSVDAREVLKMATVNGAHAMGLDNADVLAPSKDADLILLDLHQPNMQPINNIPKNIVYSGSKSNVKMVMIDGKIKYAEGQFFIGTSPDEIYTKAAEIKARIMEDLKK